MNIDAKNTRERILRGVLWEKQHPVYLEYLVDAIDFLICPQSVTPFVISTLVSFLSLGSRSSPVKWFLFSVSALSHHEYILSSLSRIPYPHPPLFEDGEGDGGEEIAAGGDKRFEVWVGIVNHDKPNCGDGIGERHNEHAAGPTCFPCLVLLHALIALLERRQLRLNFPFVEHTIFSAIAKPGGPAALCF